MDSSGQAICVTLNAAIDRTYYTERFQTGGVNRVIRVVSQAGGKGNNVARVIHRLGGNAIATGFVGGQNGRFIEEALTLEGIVHDFCQVSTGESRVCLTLADSTDQSPTEIIEPGIHVTEEDVESLRTHLQQLIESGAFVVFSGSLPPGLSIGAFASLLQLARDRGAHVVVDTSGFGLEHAVHCVPFMIKPNEQEVAALLRHYGQSISSNISTQREERDHRLSMMLQELSRRGIALPIVTLGGNGAIACCDDILYRIEAPVVDVVNTVGSGDSFLGGIIYGLMNDLPIKRTLAIGSAAGAVNAMKESAGLIERYDVMAIADDITVRTISSV